MSGGSATGWLRIACSPGASGSGYTKINGSLVTTTSYVDSAVSNWTTYYYVVKAVDTNANNSTNSAQDSAMPYQSVLIFDNDSHRIIGAGIVGPSAGDLIAETALAIEMGCDAADIGLTIHPHPTLSESVGMAAEVFEGTITDLYIPKRKG